MTPVRTCIGCRAAVDAGELVRVVRAPGGGLAVGRTLPGRGAWVHLDPACIEQAVRRRAFGRALRAAIDPDAIAALRALLEDRARMDGRAHPATAGGPDVAKRN